MLRPLNTAALLGFLIALCGLSSAASAQHDEHWDRSVLPIAPKPFEGHVGLRKSESTLDFPSEVKAPAGAPNILLIMPDDVGFGASSAFGGPIPTPALDRIAEMGVRYNQFHTTALCSPTRAALITGRNHHSNATGVIMEIGTGFPGYNSLMPKSNGSIAEVLKQNGYNTAWYGKNHNVPDWHSSQAGPFDLWPTGLGFEQFFGFIGGDTSQFTPAIFDGTRPVEPPHDVEDYHLDVDMADRAIRYIREQDALAPDKPFFVYYAPGTAHAPHHAPKEWIERFKGQFDQGWDRVREETFARQKAMGIIPPETVLTPRPQKLRAWDSLNDEQTGALRADDGGLRRRALAYGPPDRPDPRRHRGDRRDGQHAGHLPHGRQRRERRGQPGRAAQRDDLLQQHRGSLRGHLRPHRRTRRSEHVRALPGGVGARDGHAISMDEAGGVSLRRDPQRTRHLMATGDQAREARCDRSSTMSSTSSRPSSKRRDFRRPHRSTVSRNHRWRASAWPTRSTTRTPHRRDERSTSR